MTATEHCGASSNFRVDRRGVPVLLSDSWHIRLRDLDTGNILFGSTNQGAFVSSSKHFYVRFGIDL